MKDIKEVRKYVNSKLAILQDELNKATLSGSGSFYDIGLEGGRLPTGDCTEDIYDDGFENGILEGEYKTLLMLSYLLKGSD